MSSPITVTPEPSSLTLLGSALLGLGAVCLRRRRAKACAAVALSLLGTLWVTTVRADYLYECNEQGTTIGKYTTSGGTVNASFITGLNLPTDMALDGSGHIFVVNSRSSTIGEYTTSGGTVNASLIQTPSYPWGITLAGNDLFVTYGAYGSYHVAEYTTSGSTVNTSLFATPVSPLGIASDGNGHLFVAESSLGAIGEYTTSGGTVNTALITTGLYYPVALAYDDGDLFVADQIKGVSEYTTAGVLVHSNLAPGFNQPCSIALDGRGNFFVGGPEGSLTVPIGEYTTSGRGSECLTAHRILFPVGPANRNHTRTHHARASCRRCPRPYRLRFAAANGQRELRSQLSTNKTIRQFCRFIRV